MTITSARTTSKGDESQRSLVISRAELARVLGFGVGSVNTMINCTMTHPILVQNGMANYRDIDYNAADEGTITPIIEREEVFFMCDEPDGSSKAFWLQMHIKGIDAHKNNGASEPVMCVLCEPQGPDHLKLSHGWMKMILQNNNPKYNRELFYRATLGHKQIEEFEGLVRRVMGKNLKPNYEPPRSPLYSPKL